MTIGWTSAVALVACAALVVGGCDSNKNDQAEATSAASKVAKPYVNAGSFMCINRTYAIAQKRQLELFERGLPGTIIDGCRQSPASLHIGILRLDSDYDVALVGNAEEAIGRGQLSNPADMWVRLVDIAR